MSHPCPHAEQHGLMESCACGYSNFRDRVARTIRNAMPVRTIADALIRGPLSELLTACDECGAVLGDPGRHLAWHANQAARTPVYGWSGEG